MKKTTCLACAAAAVFSAILLFTVSEPAEGATLFSCGKGSFYDPRNKGECWTCEGWNRTAYAVTDGKSCSRWVPEHLYGATKHRRPKGLSCPKGQFFDLYDGGWCWSCSGGGNRTAYHINSGRACSKRGYEQFKHAKHVAPVSTCGGKGKRPCYLIERVPSCDKGLYENFQANRCDALPPGKTPWSASFDSMERVTSGLGQTCSDFYNRAGDQALHNLKASPATMGATGYLAAQGNIRFNTGFTCGIYPYTSDLLKEISFVANTPKLFEKSAKEAEKRKAQFVKAVDHAYWNRPCSDLRVGYREMCAVIEALPAKAAADCMNGLWDKIKSELQAAGRKDTKPDSRLYLEAMELGGNMAFAAALDTSLGAAMDAATGGAALGPDVARKVKMAYDFFQKIRLAFKLVAKADAAVTTMRAELNTVPACRPLIN